VLLIVALACLLAACGGDDDSGTDTSKISPNWDRRGLATVAAVANRVKKAFPGECKDYGLLPRQQYVGNARLIDSKIPLAASSCTTLGENLEFSAFTDAKTRDAFVKQRADVICAKSKKIRVPLPGLRWVVADTWSIQPDGEDVGRRVAKGLDAKYVLTACPGTRQVDWAEKDIDRVNEYAGKLKAAGLGCADSALQDRDILAATPHYITIGLPGAFNKCTIGDDINVQIASFVDTQTILAQWINNEQQYVCQQSKDTRVVIGTDWAVLLPKGEKVDEVADALNGRPFGGACPAS
jgi:hypothetical protein